MPCFSTAKSNGAADNVNLTQLSMNYFAQVATAASLLLRSISSPNQSFANFNEENLDSNHIILADSGTNHCSDPINYLIEAITDRLGVH